MNLISFNMHLLVGLGNIGRKYEKTRHNFGFLLLDKIVSDYILVSQGKKFKSEVFSGKVLDRKIIALKPYTFMNLSGQAVMEAKNFYKINNENIIVLHDDIDLPLGKIKMKIGGGNAGHNGLKSIDGLIGKNYVRLRLGVGRPQNKEFEIANYVLEKFSREEFEQTKEISEKISMLLQEVLELNIEKFINKFYS